MEHEPLKLGRIAKKVENALKEDFGECIFVYVEESDLRLFAKKWPNDYLKKVEEAATILKKAIYVAYVAESKSLYLIDEFITKSEFKKAGLRLERVGDHWELKEILAFGPEKLSWLLRVAKVKRII